VLHCLLEADVDRLVGPKDRHQPDRPRSALVDAWLRRQPKLKASVIWERLVAEHGFTGHYQRVKVYVREHRARLTGTEAEPTGFHRRFDVLAGAQAQVDWGDEGQIQTPTPAAFGIQLPHDPVVLA
jgi:ribosomal protein L15E